MLYTTMSNNNVRLTGSRLETDSVNAVQHQLRMGYTNTDNAFYGIKSSIVLATRLAASGAEYAMQFNNYGTNNTADVNYIINTGNNQYKTMNLIKIEGINASPYVTTNAHKANVVNLSTGQVDADVINANVINAQVINVMYVSTSYMSTNDVYASMISTSDVRFKYGAAENLSTTLLGYGSAFGDALTANSVSYINATGDYLSANSASINNLSTMLMATGALAFDAASGNSISTINLSTNNLAFNNMRGAAIVATSSINAPLMSTIYLDATTISSIHANIVSVDVEDIAITGRINFTGSATVNALNNYSGMMVQEASGSNQIGLNISSGTNYITEKLCFVTNNGNNVINGIEFVSSSAGVTITSFITNLSSMNDKILYGGASLSGHGVSTVMLSTGAAYIGTLETSGGASFPSISSINVSTGALFYGAAQGLSLSAVDASADSLTFVAAAGPSISTVNLQTTGFAFANAEGTSVSTVNLQTTGFAFVAAAGPSVSTVNLQTDGFAFVAAAGPSVSTVNLQTTGFAFVAAAGPSVSTVNLQTTGFAFANAEGTSVSAVTLTAGTANIGSLTLSGGAGFPSISSINISTGALFYGAAHGLSLSAVNASADSLTFVAAAGPSVSTVNLQTTGFAFVAAAGPSVSTVNLQTTGFAFANAEGTSVSAVTLTAGTANIGSLTTTGSASVPSISSMNVSTGALFYGAAHGLSLSAVNASADSLTFVAAAGPSISTVNLQTTGFAFANADGTSISTLNLSTGGLAFRNAAGPLLNASSIVYNTASGDYLNTNNISSAIAHIDSGFGRNLDLTDHLYVRSISSVMISTAWMFSDHAYFNNLTCEAFVTLSDRRFKKNVAPLMGSLDMINRLEPVYYDWNDRENMRPGHQEIGFIAQSVDAVVPNVVSVQGDDSRHAVAYDRITALLTGAIQELFAKVNDLESRLEVFERN
jgi:hypothetical protein